jgi:serine phosphatase RsbU (regulator of sigma subunit)
LKPRETLRLVGLLAFLVAGLSIGDMFRSRPWDGVVLEADAPGRLLVRSVVAESGAAEAGILPGEQIIGIDRTLLQSSSHAASLVNRHEIGESLPYLVQGRGELREVMVSLSPRRIGNLNYVYACLLGFAFFFVGLFVLERQPRRRAAQVFFLVSTLFLLFLVCRLRPASYSWLENLVLTIGTVALLFLPATFLHFFLIFPRPVRLRPEPGQDNYRPKRLVWLASLTAMYLIPPIVLTATVSFAMRRGASLDFISGLPAQSWWVLAIYMLVALTTLAIKARDLKSQRERRGAGLVLFGFVFGLLPFLVTAVAFPSYLHNEKLLPFGIGPLILVPLTFAYAIVRFQLMEIRVILRKSLLYTVTTIVVTAVYALGIALFNALTRGTTIAASPFFPIVFALVIVLLFEPLRKRIQTLVNRRFFAERQGLEKALEKMGEALTAQVDLQEVVRDLVGKLPQLLGLHFAALYLVRNDALEREAGPARLPERLPMLPQLHDALAKRRGLTVIDEIEPWVDSSDLGLLIDELTEAGAQVIGDLTTPRRHIGMVVLSGKIDQTMPLDPSELTLLRRLLDQAAVALETSMLLEERTQQAELERELEIAAAVQEQLLPPQLDFGAGWNVAAVCRPARHVGGDFFTELPGPRNGSRALVYGDVAGKSVSGALMMMAAHEVLHSLALTHRDPEQLLSLANRRLYDLGRRKSFVALAYMASTAEGDGLLYLLAGQPQPLVRSSSGEVRELELPPNRIPLGALDNGSYCVSRAPMESGDLVLGYSDGVVDAQSLSGESFGVDRLARVVAGAACSPEGLVERVLESLDEFTQGTEPYDDVTLVAVECDREAIA